MGASLWSWYTGFSLQQPLSCRVQGLGHKGFSSRSSQTAALRHVESQTKGQRSVPFIGGPILNHWATTEVPSLNSLSSLVRVGLLPTRCCLFTLQFEPPNLESLWKGTWLPSCTEWQGTERIAISISSHFILKVRKNLDLWYLLWRGVLLSSCTKWSCYMCSVPRSHK